jgi:HTH-type transcriptional regulator/antitoxin HigA
MITIRGKWADIFWFSIFHEIGHILLHDQGDVILENNAEGKKEKEADKFAANILIPPDEYANFIEIGSFYPDDIVNFAADIGIPPGIVVGRLQHDEYLQPQFCNDLRILYKWEDNVNP